MRPAGEEKRAILLTKTDRTSILLALKMPRDERNGKGAFGMTLFGKKKQEAGPGARGAADMKKTRTILRKAGGRA